MGNDPEFHLNIHSTSLNEEKENVTLMDSAVQTDPILQNAISTQTEEVQTSDPQQDPFPNMLNI